MRSSASAPPPPARSPTPTSRASRRSTAPHSFEGSPDAINAWVRVYPERARADAARADERLAAGGAPPLCGVPLGLKDLYAVAGHPLTASSGVTDLAPDEDSVVAARLFAAGMVLLGHLHTHEFAAGGGTDQVGNPWDLSRGPGGSSGGSGAALASRTTPAATGTDTAGSLRIPSALCGTSTIKATRGLLPLRGILPLSHSHDHPGPMTRTLRDTALMLDAMLGAEPGPIAALADATPRPLAGARLALSPRIGLVDVDPDVADGFEDALSALRRLGATIVEPPPPDTPLDVGQLFLEVVATDMLSWHAPLLAEKRDDYRQSNRDILDFARGPGDDRHRVRRRAVAAPAGHRRVDGLARRRAHRRDRGADRPHRGPAARARLRRVLHRRGDRLHLAHAHVGLDGHARRLAALGRRPAQRAARERVAHRRAGSEAALLERGIALQDELGVPEPPAR